MKEGGFNVLGFLDNESCLNGKNILGIGIENPEILKKQTKNELSNIHIIVCQQFTNIYEAISYQLKEIGLKESQITHNMF